MMTKTEKITIALQQVTDLETLCQGLDYPDYLTSKCLKLRYELQRQLSIINAGEDAVFDR